MSASMQPSIRPPAAPEQAPNSAPRRLTDLPGPRGLPILGNALQFKSSKVHLIIEDWARQYGSFFSFSLGPQRMLGITDHELIGKLLRERPDTFRRPAIVGDTVREMGVETGLFNAEGAAWQNHRRMVMASFSPGNVRAYFPSLLKVTQRLHGRWVKAARSGSEIDLQADLMRFTVDAITGLAFGHDINTLESDEDVIQHHLDKLFPALGERINAIVPYWRFIKLPSDRALDRSVAVVREAIQGFIAQARKQMAAEPQRREQPSNLLEAMIAAADQQGSGVDDRDVAGNMFTMLLAGEDTTANTLAWLIHLLMRNPQALQRAQAEACEVAGDLAAFTPERMAALDYIEACANEAMRLKPVAPFQVLEALKPTVVGDVAVPTGTLIWCIGRLDTQDERYFPEAQAFKPERWLDEGQGSAASSTAKRVSMPFGGGPRICPGRYLALLEIKMAMAMLLSRFDIESVYTSHGGEPQEYLTFTMTPTGLRMRLRER